MIFELVTMAALVAAPPPPAGLEVHLSECASGGFDYFFFADGVVIAECWGCESTPRVQQGRWRRDGKDVVIAMEREWKGVGRGRIVLVAAGNVFESYVAVARSENITPDQRRFTPDELEAVWDSCGLARPHQRAEDPHAFLRQFDGEFPDTFRRVLGPADLRGKDAGQLRLMRNEIYARYGLRFSDPILAAHFSKMRGYAPRLTDVEAFLSPVERENVARLAAAEKSARRAAR